jgi:hypothetical protein
MSVNGGVSALKAGTLINYGAANFQRGSGNSRIASGLIAISEARPL